MKAVKHLETGMDLWSTATPLVCVARSVCDVRSEKTVRSDLRHLAGVSWGCPGGLWIRE